MKIKNFIGFSVILLFLEVLLFREFIFGDLYFIFKDLGSDSYVNDYPLLYNRMIAAKDGFLPGWSFHNGLGENLYPYSFEPFSWFLFKVTGISAEQMMLIIPLIYIYLSGLMLYLFLSEHKLAFPAKVFASLSWAFSGYYILSATWSVTLFCPIAFHFSFLLFALQRCFTSKEYHWIVIVFALIGISYPVNLFFALIFSVGYCILFLYRNQPKKRIYFNRILFVGTSAAIGIGLSCWMLLSTISLMKNSPRGSNEISTFQVFPDCISSKNELISTIYRLFSPNILGDVNNFSLYRNYFEAPLLYCGIFTLLLFSQISILGKKGKFIAIISVLPMVLIFLSPAIRNLVWFYSGDYYRVLNTFFALMLCVISGFIFSGIINSRKVFIKPLLITAVFCIVILLFGLLNFKENHPSKFLIPVFFTLTYTGILFFSKKIKFKRLIIFILPVLLVEIITMSSQIISQRNICSTSDILKKGYYDDSFEAIKNINKTDKSFFRIEKDFYSGVSWLASYNEAKIQNYNSSSAYNSFNNKNYINFLKVFGVIKPGKEPETRFVKGLGSSPFLMKLCSVKYFVASKPESDQLLQLGFEEVDDKGNFKILKDPNSLPFGFCYDNILGVREFNKYSKKEKESFGSRYLVVDDKDLKQFKNPKIQPEFPKNNIYEQIDSLKINHFSNNHISGTINVANSKFLFFSMPFDEGWKVKDNGKLVNAYKAFGGLTFIPLKKGNHKIILDYSPPFKLLGIYISTLSLVLFIGLLFYQKKKLANGKDIKFHS